MTAPTTAPPMLTNIMTSLAATHAQLLSQLAAHNLPTTNTSATSPTELWTSTSPDLHKTRETILQQCQDLQLLVGGPQFYFWRIFGQGTERTALAAALKFGVFDLFPADGSPVSLDQLKEKVALDKGRLARILRFLATGRVVEEVREEWFAATCFTKFLLDDRRNVDCLDMLLTEPAKVGLQFPDYLHENPELEVAVSSGKPSPFAFALGDEMYTYLAKNPARAAVFTNAMEVGGALGAGISNELLRRWLARNTTTEEKERKLVVDVGGGSGHISVDLAKDLPHLHFHIQDSNAGMLKQGESTLPADLKSRFSFQQHDFFTPQPTNPSDPSLKVKAFFLRRCLHNWDDGTAAKIIRSFSNALEADPEARLLIFESVLPASATAVEEGGWERARQRRLRHMDFQMMSMLGAKQRTEKDWHEVVGMADGRFEVVGIEAEEGMMGLVEVRLKTE